MLDSGLMRALAVSFPFLMLSVAQAHTITPNGPGELLRIPHTEGDAYLWVPYACTDRPCSLLVVSHSRGNSSDATLQKPHLMVFFKTFVQADIAVLISNDAGTHTWGNEKALLYLKTTWETARSMFRFDGKTFALGYSMGGLPATLSVQRNLYPVSALVLMDARVNLQDAAAGQDQGRVQEIKAAYHEHATSDSIEGRDPLKLAFHNNIPIMVMGSPEDRTVPFKNNGEQFFQQFGKNPFSVKMLLPGGHLHMNRFSADTAQDIIGFLKSLPGPVVQEASSKSFSKK